MKLFYIANIRIPTEKAHGVAIARSCEAFGHAGVETTLVVPRRRTPIEKTVFEAYGVKSVFTVKFLPTLDLLSEKAGPFVFWLQTVTFQLFLLAFLLFQDRKTVLYTRDAGFIPLRYLGFKVVLECHLIPKNRGAFFSLARRANRVLVISQALKNAFIEAGFAQGSVLVAPSGVDLSVFDIDATKEHARKMLDLPQNPPSGGLIAVYTGNFTTMGEDKGISDIIKALPLAPNVLFVAVGGSEKDRGRYVAEASELGVLGRVILRGTTTQKMLALYQKAADVLMMPFPDTPHYRNHMSPVKMFEYMAAKRPIIASNLPTIREVLNEKNAVLVPPGEPAAIARALNDAISNSELSAKAEKAYTDVAEYSWDARTRKVLQFLGK
jgi:glycosyltransferase involved in cell wall biosynthesis